VAYEWFLIDSIPSGRSKMDWTATRPGPVSLTMMFR
jgi:hypothetical protein